MKRKLQLKSILLTAALFVGANVWADSKVTFYSNDFSASSSLELITVSAGANQVLDLANDNDAFGNYVRQTTQDRARDMYMNLSSLLSASFADYTNYVVEFDAAFKSGATNRTAGNKLYLPSTGSTNIFYMATPSTQVGSGDLVFTVTGADEGKEITLKALTWYHFKFEISATQVTYTVTKASDASDVTNGTGTLTITDSRIKQIYFGTARSTGQSRLDNVDIYTMVAGDVANDPVISESAVLGDDRQYSITFGEGETLHYTLPGGTEQTSTTSPTVVTATAEGTLSAYTTKGTATSSTVNVTVTHGAITLNAPTYTLSDIKEDFGKTYTITIDNNSVELKPSATMSYVFTPAGGSAESPVAISNGGKISAVLAGTYVITAKADGYTSSTLTIINNQVYAKTKAYDFTALKASDLDLTTPKWTGPTANTAYQTSSSSTLFSSDGYTVVSEHASNSAIEGVNLNEATILMIGYGLHPNGNNGGFSLAGLNSDDLVRWSYYDYGTEVVAVKGYDAKLTGNGNHWRYLVTKAEVFSPASSPVSLPVTVKTTGTTFTSAYAIDCANLPAGVTAYKVTKMTASQVTAEEVTEAVAAGTGLIFKATTETSYDIPVVASGATVTGNLLKAAVTATAVDANAAYGLSDGKFVKLNAGSVPAGKAYLLATSIQAPELGIDFGGTTAITNTNRTNDTNIREIYNINGQRIAQPTKGLYIVNGKKVIMK